MTDREKLAEIKAILKDLPYAQLSNGLQTEIITRLEKSLAREAVAREALAYYANTDNWTTYTKNQDSIAEEDCKFIVIGEDSEGVVTSNCGGNNAREALAKMDSIK